MEKIRINDAKANIIIYLQKNKLWGYIFNHDGSFKYVAKENIEYFNFLFLSNNSTKLASVDKYDVILDNETNLKHYFYHGEESFTMFFLNNGEDAICYKQDQEIKNSILNKLKTFTVKMPGTSPRQVTTSLIALIMVAVMGLGLTACDVAHINEQEENDETLAIVYQANVDTGTELEVEEVHINIPPKITLQDIKNKIYSSKDLEEEEKAFLYNEDLFSALLPLFNESDYLRYYVYKFHLDGMDIIGYGPENPYYNTSSGYYDSQHPRFLFIRNYKGLTDDDKDTIAHEFIHLLEEKHGLLGEACAEIISFEFFSNSTISTYQSQVFYVRKLMETIGPSPIWHLVFTGDYSKIESRVKPYLSEEEYQEFITNLTARVENANLDRLEELLSILYKNIYGNDISYNQVIQTMDATGYDITNDYNKYYRYNLVRYYFNPNKINQENSYYEVEELEDKTIGLAEACANGWVYLFETIKTDLTLEQGLSILNNPNVQVFRDTSDYSIISNGFKYYISIDEQYFENVDITALQDEMIKNGFGKYVLWESSRITYEDYITGNYHEGAEITNSFSSRIVKSINLDDNTVACRIPTGNITKQEYLPPISEVESIFLESKGITK